MPGNKQVYSAAINAADRLRWDSQWSEAMQEYQRALAEFPDDATARNGLGFCFMQTRQWQEALDAYEYILKRESGNVIALSKTAELYGILGRRDDAYKAYMHLADLYSQAGQGQRAEAAWQRAVQLSPGNPEPHERLAGYYFGKKDFTLMIQERIAAAQGYFARNERVSARVQCEEVLRADSQNVQAHTLLAQIMGLVSGSLAQPSIQTEGASGFSQNYTQADTLNRTVHTDSELQGSSGNATAPVVPTGNTSGGNTGIMGNMGSAGNYGGVNSANGAPLATAGNGAGGAGGSRHRIAASQVTGALRQAQTFQTQGRFNDAIDLCEQILESGIDRPDARYFLGWLYQEQQRWDEAIRQFQMLLNDPDYALSCYYALGQCYRARGDLRTATVHFDEAVDRVNLDALTEEESDQLVQLCQEAAEAHRMLGEQEQALTVYHALLGFLKSRGWNEKVAQVEFMLQQVQNAPVPPQAQTRPVTNNTARPQQNPGNGTAQPFSDASAMSFDMNGTANGQMGQMGPVSQPTLAQPPVASAQPVPLSPPSQTSRPAQQPVPPAPPTQSVPTAMSPNPISSVGELPDWLTGILSDADKTQVANKSSQQVQREDLPEQPTVEQKIETPVKPAQLTQQSAPQNSATASASWLTEDVKPANTTRDLASEPSVQSANAPSNAPARERSAALPEQPATTGSQPVQQVYVAPLPSPVVAPAVPVEQVDQSAATAQIAPVVPAVPAVPAASAPVQPVQQDNIFLQEPSTQPAKQQASQRGVEDLLSQIAGESTRDEELKRVAETVLTSTANLPENVRLQVVRSMQDIQKYINHGLLIQASEECLRVIDMAPQYLDVHQVLCEIYVRQGKVEQAITKYAILVDTYIVNGRADDAISTYRRILQLEPNNLTYRMRLINLLSNQGDKEDLLRERTLAAESYLRLGYMDRALTELEQALQESPTSVPTRLNYALALQKLGRSQQAVAEYQRVLQVDPRNLTALIRWHIAMITTLGTSRATMLEVLSRVCWQLRGEGQRNYEVVAREYVQAADGYPNNADILYSLGQIHQQAGEYDKAVDAYEQSMRDSSVEVFARTSAAQCLLAQGRPEAAIQQLEQALQRVRSASTSMDPAIWAARPREDGEEHRAPEVEISLMLAKAYERTGRREQMQAILRQVKQAKPEQNEVASALAEISARQGDVGSALQEYAELVQHYRNSRQTESALRVLNEMVRLAPQDSRAHIELADIYINRGLLDEGIAELRLLADVYLRRNQLEQAGEALQRAGDIYAELGNNEEALANLRRAIELRPNSMDLLRSVVGFCLQCARQLERTNDSEAERYQTIAAEYQSTIAHHYFDTHQVKESVAALQQLITIDHGNYEAYDLLGQTYQSVGEYEQASRVYRNLARINPESSIAHERLTTLQELRTR